MSFWDETSADEEETSVLQRRRAPQDAELDMTPMIDVTFLLLIFFIVSTVPDVQKALELPPARYGVGVNHRAAVIVTIADRGIPGKAAIYLADGKVGEPLSHDLAKQEAAIKAAIEQGLIEGKSTVFIKAERGVLHREVARVAAIASTIEGTRLNLAVMEAE